MRLAMAAGLLGAAAAHADDRVALPVYRSFGDWIVACDVTGACDARGFTDGGEHGLALSLLRDAGAEAEPSLVIADVPEGDATVRLGDRAWRPAPGASEWLPTDADRGEARALRIAGVAAVRDFAAAARRADRVTAAGESGTLAGFNAAMLFIDDVQGRVGTPGALARPGASAAPPPGPRPAPVRTTPAQGLRPLPDAEARRYAVAVPVPADACDDAVRVDGPALYDLGGGEVLSLFACRRGAYQEAVAVYRGPRGAPARARPASLPFPPGISGPDEHGLVVGAYFDPDRATLSSSAKARGLGDCGESARWIYDGSAFRLEEFAMLDRCGWYAPGDFPVLWRTARAGGERP